MLFYSFLEGVVENALKRPYAIFLLPFIKIGNSTSLSTTANFGTGLQIVRNGSVLEKNVPLNDHNIQQHKKL